MSFNSSHDFINVISILSTFPAVTYARDAAPGDPGYCQRALTNFPYLLRLYARVGSIPDLGSFVWCGGSMNPPFVMPLSSHDIFFEKKWVFFCRWKKVDDICPTYFDPKFPQDSKNHTYKIVRWNLAPAVMLGDFGEIRRKSLDFELISSCSLIKEINAYNYDYEGTGLRGGSTEFTIDFLQICIGFPNKIYVWKKPPKIISSNHFSSKIARTWENIFASGLFYHQSTYPDYLKSRVRPPESDWGSS